MQARPVVVLLGLLAICRPVLAESPFFQIQVVDAETGRGVPLVELRTVNEVRYYTDSNGIVALQEPELVGQHVFFHIRSHGYEFPEDGFGNRGTALTVTPGGSATLKVRRLNIAERLYRVTGAGIYRDSILLGEPVPICEPLLNGRVFGSDSVVNAVYRGQIYWFWGDTSRPSHPLGNFHVPGATSELPSAGGLDPHLGVNLTYFLDESGFAKPTAQMPGKGPTWIGGLVVLTDEADREQMFAGYAKIDPPLRAYERGLVRWDDESERFEQFAVFDEETPLYPAGHTFLHTIDGIEYVFFCDPYPLVRVRATPEDLSRPEAWEAFTCLEEGSRLDQPELDRDGNGVLRYDWKRNTPAVGPAEQEELIRDGLLKRHEALLRLRDRETGKPVQAHRGSVSWNEYRRRWVMIAGELFGTSPLGEIWYAEADTPLGPWAEAVKIVSHDQYSFYNPKQHPMLDQQGGRFLYFEGTYTRMFSGNPEPTPRYDYNQIMYRLDLADPRLALPVPVYWQPDEHPQRFRTANPEGEIVSWDDVAFLALDRPGEGTVPVYERQTNQSSRLQVGSRDGDYENEPLFHALPMNTEPRPATAVLLYEYVEEKTGRFFYSADAEWTQPGLTRTDPPICLVWSIPEGRGTSDKSPTD